MCPYHIYTWIRQKKVCILMCRFRCAGRLCAAAFSKTALPGPFRVWLGGGTRGPKQVVHRERYVKLRVAMHCCHSALLLASGLEQKHFVNSKEMRVFASKLSEVTAGLRHVSHLEGLTISIGADKDSIWTAGLLHSMLKVCHA